MNKLRIIKSFELYKSKARFANCWINLELEAPASWHTARSKLELLTDATDDSVLANDSIRFTRHCPLHYKVVGSTLCNHQ